MKRILVTGTWRPFEYEARRRAQMVGIHLARSGFGLVTGTWPGIDCTVAEAFNAELKRLRLSAQERYQQIQFRSWRRMVLSLLPVRSFKATPDATVRVKNGLEGSQQALTLCDAAVMIGGRTGALEVARQFMTAGKPVFPIPFSGGRSDEVFQQILRTWTDAPIPGLSRHQLLRLALPWEAGPGPLIELIKGTLADKHDIFISYRRSDSGSAVGRIHKDLSDYFGSRRVFIDEKRIEPSAVWRKSIDDGLEHCKLGLIVIGRQWLDSRINDEADVLRSEVAYLLERKISLPILVDDAALPTSDQLPAPLKRLPAVQARSIGNANWDETMSELIRMIESVLTRSNAGSLEGSPVDTP